MKNNWQEKKLVDVCIVERGSSPRPIEKFITDDEDGVNWIKIGDTKNVDKYIYKTRQKITKKGAEKSRFVKKGDFILSNSMSFGKPFIMKTEGYIHDGWFVLRLHDFIDTEYFYHLLTSPVVYDQFQSLASGAIVKNISGDLVKKVVLPIPPLLEQRRIVAILDEVFAAIGRAKENAEKNLQNARELFDSYLQSVFANSGDGWEEKTLDKVFEIKPPKKEAKEKLNDTDLVTFLPMEDLGILSKDFVGEKERQLKDVAGSYTYFADNDVLMAKITPCFENGKLGIARNLTNGIGFGSSEYIVFRSKGELISDYLYYFLARNQFREEGKQRMSGAVGHKRVSKDFIEECKISFPKSPSEQKTIVDKFDRISAETKKLENIYRQKINDLDELKKSILQKAFQGELTANNRVSNVSGM